MEASKQIECCVVHKLKSEIKATITENYVNGGPVETEASKQIECCVAHKLKSEPKPGKCTRAYARQHTQVHAIQMPLDTKVETSTTPNAGRSTEVQHKLKSESRPRSTPSPASGHKVEPSTTTGGPKPGKCPQARHTHASIPTSTGPAETEASNQVLRSPQAWRPWTRRSSTS